MDSSFTGKFVSAAGALEEIDIGCTLGYVKVVNVTANVVYEFFNDGTNSMGISTNGADGVVTQAATGITIDSNGFSVAAAALTADDVVHYVATRL